jgi:hypothetical protein
MSEIKNYTMNFSFGRPQCGLNVQCTLACTEVHCVSTCVTAALSPE